MSFKYHTNSSTINLWISKGIGETERATGAGNSQTEWPTVVDNGRMYVKTNGGYFKQPKVSFDSNVIYIYMVYKLDPIASNRDDTFTVSNALFGSCKITKNTDTSKYKYKGYGICFDRDGEFGHIDKKVHLNTLQMLEMLLFLELI